jgi:hypothetical protein
MDGLVAVWLEDMNTVWLSFAVKSEVLFQDASDDCRDCDILFVGF